MMRLIALVVVLSTHAAGLSGQVVVPRGASELPQRTTSALPQRTISALGDTSVPSRVWQLFSTAEAMERAGRRREAVEAFQSAAVAAQREGDFHFAVSLVGRAAAVQDPAFTSVIRTQLAGSPLLEQERDLEKEQAFVRQTRQTVSTLRIGVAGDLSQTIFSAADAQAVLEDLASAGRQTDIHIRSSHPGMEVRVRRWIFHFTNGPWETVRADTTLDGRMPVRYEFCYLNPATRRAELIDQPCTDGDSCSITLPSAHAVRVDNCASGS